MAPCSATPEAATSRPRNNDDDDTTQQDEPDGATTHHHVDHPDHTATTTNHHDDYRIALYYCYIPVPNVPQHCTFQQALGERLELGGRIRVAPEGLNGVLSGLTENLQAYRDALHAELTGWGQGSDIDDDNAQSDNDSSSSWELDVKFCQLRSDLDVAEQLFDGWSVKETKKVISLVGTLDQNNSNSNKSKKSKRRQRRKQQQQKNNKDDHHKKDEATTSSVADVTRYAEQLYLQATTASTTTTTSPQSPATHLSPHEWHHRLTQLTATKENNNSHNNNDTVHQKQERTVTLLDCRNVYESNIGHFRVPHADTVLTNTRKFSELPHVLVEQADRLVESDEIYMYCTGGVRCETASIFLQSLLKDKCQQKNDKATPPRVYQLHGGIQRYLEATTTMTPTNDDNERNNNNDDDCYFQGKNFVFDPRRHDPLHNGKVVGTCLVCHQPHDDYDSGAAPRQNHESRCWNCRILVLVCNDCRSKVSCWNEVNDDKPHVYCGGVDQECLHMPPVQIISGGHK